MLLLHQNPEQPLCVNSIDKLTCFNYLSAESVVPRLDTKLESSGAEFLVLGNLLLRRIPAYKTYTNMPGYDLVATNAEKHTSARIQVKSRWETGASGFPMANFDCDFVVAAFLNRGSKSRKKDIGAPAFYVFPIAVIVGLPRTQTWNKVYLRNIKKAEFYRENWLLISEFLGGTPSGG